MEIPMLFIAAKGGDTVPIEVLWAGAIAVLLSALVTVGGLLWQTRKTLRHERALREREDLRVLIDEAAARIDLLVFEVMEAITDLYEIARKASRDFEIPVADLPDDENEVIGKAYEEKNEQLFAAIRECDGFKSRLGLRLGDDHVVVRHYAAATDCLRGMQERFRANPFEGKKSQGAQFARTGELMGFFRQASYELIGARLDG